MVLSSIDRLVTTLHTSNPWYVQNVCILVHSGRLYTLVPESPGIYIFDISNNYYTIVLSNKSVDPHGQKNNPTSTQGEKRGPLCL
jgi:hypothetical protein